MHEQRCSSAIRTWLKQVYLGGYEREDHAAEAYDVAALKCKGPRVKTNFPISKYALHLCLECLSFSAPYPHLCMFPPTQFYNCQCMMKADAHTVYH